MAQITAIYKSERKENLDEFYKEIEVTYILRRMMCNQTIRMLITKDKEEQWNFKTIYIFGSKTFDNRFKLGEEYEEELPNGNLLKAFLHLNDAYCITTMEGASKFVTKGVGKLGAAFTFERYCEFNEDRMIMTMQASSGPTVAKCYFKRISSQK